MSAPYIAEAQTARWTSDGLRDTFRSAGFEVREWQLTQFLEKSIPADSIFFWPTLWKIFGFQYKTIYHNKEDFWPLDKAQHETLQRYPWIFYCCSELKDVSDRAMALHCARFYRPRFNFQSELPVSGLFRGGHGYLRWGAFYRRLKGCRIGAKVHSQDELRDLMADVSGLARFREVRQMMEVLMADFERRIVLAQRFF